MALARMTGQSSLHRRDRWHFQKHVDLQNLMSADSNEIPAARRTLGTDSITKAMINDNVIDIARLDVSDGSNGQFLSTNGGGTLSFASGSV